MTEVIGRAAKEKVEKTFVMQESQMAEFIPDMSVLIHYPIGVDRERSLRSCIGEIRHISFSAPSMNFFIES